jgi:hypothetical protein
VVVAHVASTEPPFSLTAEHQSWPALESALKNGGAKDLLPASSLYALAALELGMAYVNFTPNAARPLLLTAGSLVRNPGNHTLFRGTDLGVSTLASMTAGDANVSFTNAPAMLGGGGAKDSKNVSILPGACGNNTISTGAGTALVTYDSIYGLRLLDTATEFSPSVTNLQTALDNVRIVNTSGSGIVTNTLLSDTTINSLSIDETGIGTNTGVSVVGDDPSRMLTLNSGTIFSRQIVTTATASDAVVISNLVLNLNGEEGNIISANQNLQPRQYASTLVYLCVDHERQRQGCDNRSHWRLQRPCPVHRANTTHLHRVHNSKLGHPTAQQGRGVRQHRRARRPHPQRRRDS